MKSTFEYTHKHESDRLNRLGSVMVIASLNEEADDWEGRGVVTPSLDHELTAVEIQKIKDKAFRWVRECVYVDENTQDVRVFLAMRHEPKQETWSISSGVDYFYNTPRQERIEVSVVSMNRMMEFFMKNEADESFADFVHSGALRGAKIDLVYSKNKEENIIHGVKVEHSPQANDMAWSSFMEEMRLFFSEIAIDEFGDIQEEAHCQHRAIRGTVSMEFAVRAIKRIQWHVFYDRRDRETCPIPIHPEHVEAFLDSIASMDA